MALKGFRCYIMSEYLRQRAADSSGVERAS